MLSPDQPQEAGFHKASSPTTPGPRYHRPTDMSYGQFFGSAEQTWTLHKDCSRGQAIYDPYIESHVHFNMAPETIILTVIRRPLGLQISM